MEKVIYGFLSQGSVELVERQSKLYVRYDAGAHQVVWREDEITQEEAQAIMQDESAISSVLINVQLRLKKQGITYPISNWCPLSARL
ncbi:Uncharacterised protein [Vibrio mimicus]|uniref:hypothetical protein n=1 Tax=Vibrio mimicus TaxID=674 RepID=UPI0002B9AE38|nr:hypothetical protein [Vibrio mimicus]EMB48294.1 hypothetical protein D908_19913 [Vibrio mimicus CAIM 602]MBY7676493.1 hypothetical protein [Vibrio mimicus]MBY7728382.1 hypothetical protein [Vibrio mimicus]SUQ23551.1 Uncharacterised protein [Vibrio mimicus]